MDPRTPGQGMQERLATLLKDKSASDIETLRQLLEEEANLLLFFSMIKPSEMDKKLLPVFQSPAVLEALISLALKEKRHDLILGILDYFSSHTSLTKESKNAIQLVMNTAINTLNPADGNNILNAEAEKINKILHAMGQLAGRGINYFYQPESQILLDILQKHNPVQYPQLKQLLKNRAQQLARKDRLLLMRAAKDNNLAQVKHLLALDCCNINAWQGGYVGNALKYAVENGNIKMMRLLLQNGADPRVKYAWHESESPLGTAIKKGLDIRRLIPEIKDPNILRDMASLALDNNRSDLVLAMLDYSNINRELSDESKQAIPKATGELKAEQMNAILRPMTNRILRHIQKPPPSAEKLAILEKLIHLKWIIEAKKITDLKSRLKRTASDLSSMRTAIEHNEFKKLEELIKRDTTIDITVRDSRGMTLLEAALERKILLDVMLSDADLTEEDIERFKSKIAEEPKLETKPSERVSTKEDKQEAEKEVEHFSTFVASENNKKIISLLSNKLDVNARVTQGLSLLHIAVIARQPVSDILSFLFRGADFSARDKAGKRPCDYVSGNHPLFEYKALLEKGFLYFLEPGSQSLLDTIKKGNAEQYAIIQTFLKNHVKNLQKKGQFLLIEAAERNERNKVKHWLAHGLCNINAIRGCAFTALGSAVRSQHIEMVKILLDYGADPDLYGFDRWPPMHDVSSSSEIAKELLKCSSEKIEFARYNSSTAVRQIVTDFYAAGNHVDYLIKEEKLHNMLELIPLIKHPNMLKKLVLHALEKNRLDVILAILDSPEQKEKLPLLIQKPLFHKILHHLVKNASAGSLNILQKMKEIPTENKDIMPTLERTEQLVHDQMDRNKIDLLKTTARSSSLFYNKKIAPFARIVEAIHNHRIADLEKIITYNTHIDLTMKDDDGRTLLDMAYTKLLESRSDTATTDKRENSEKIFLFLAEKIGINQRTAQNQSLLHLAVQKQAPLSDLVILLLKGINPKLRDKAGKKPIDYATAGSSAHTLLANGISCLWKKDSKISNEILESLRTMKEGPLKTWALSELQKVTSPAVRATGRMRFI